MEFDKDGEIVAETEVKYLSVSNIEEFIKDAFVPVKGRGNIHILCFCKVVSSSVKA